MEPWKLSAVSCSCDLQHNTGDSSCQLTQLGQQVLLTDLCQHSESEDRGDPETGHDEQHPGQDADAGGPGGRGAGHHGGPAGHGGGGEGGCRGQEREVTLHCLVLQILEATREELDTEDWALNMEICDIINHTEEGPTDAVKAIKKR